MCSRANRCAHLVFALHMRTRQDTILRFFETPEETILTVQLSPAGVLTPFLGIPATMRAKTSYFVKRSPVEVTRENYRDVVVPGDMAPKPIEELSVLVEEVAITRRN